MKHYALTSTICLTLFAASLRTIAQQPLSQSLQTSLQSPDFKQREDAMQLLVEADTSQARAALIALLQKEDKVSRDAYVKAGGVDAVYGEEYSEYFATLVEVVMRLAKLPHWKEQALPVLADWGYEPDGFFAAWLASHEDLVLPKVEALTNSKVDVDRSAAVGVAGEIGKQARTGSLQLGPSDLARVHALLLKGSQDKDKNVRLATINALGRAADPYSLSLLRNIATSDTSYDADARTYPLRIAATAQMTQLPKP